MEPDLGSWQLPDISRSHLYRGTIAWTPPTAIYRAYTVYGFSIIFNLIFIMNFWEKDDHMDILLIHRCHSEFEKINSLAQDCGIYNSSAFN